MRWSFAKKTPLNKGVRARNIKRMNLESLSQECLALENFFLGYTRNNRNFFFGIVSRKHGIHHFETSLNFGSSQAAFDFFFSNHFALHSFQGFVVQVVNRKTDNNILIFSENRFFYSIFHRVTAINCSFVNVFSAKETVFCTLHLDVQKSARASRRKRIHDDFAALRHPKSACVIEGVFELLLSDKFSGNGFLAYNILSFGRNLHKFVPIISLTNKSTNENPELCKHLFAKNRKKFFAGTPCMIYREAA